MLTKSQVKYIQSLKEKKFRKEYGVFIAEGPKIINELLGSDSTESVALYATACWWQTNRNLKNRLPFAMFYELEDQEMERISCLTTPNQVLGIFKQPDCSGVMTFKHAITLLLDGIQDPGNLGTIIRIADWFGIKQIVASKDSADVYNPKVVQSTMGSIVRVKVLYEDIDNFLTIHKDIPLYASALQGKPLASFGKVREGMLLIGNESRGVSEHLIQLASYQVTIPKFGQAESLNAAVATGIILSQLV